MRTAFLAFGMLLCFVGFLYFLGIYGDTTQGEFIFLALVSLLISILCFFTLLHRFFNSSGGPTFGRNSRFINVGDDDPADLSNSSGNTTFSQQNQHGIRHAHNSNKHHGEQQQSSHVSHHEPTHHENSSSVHHHTTHHDTGSNWNHTTFDGGSHHSH